MRTYLDLPHSQEFRRMSPGELVAANHRLAVELSRLTDTEYRVVAQGHPDLWRLVFSKDGVKDTLAEGSTLALADILKLTVCVARDAATVAKGEVSP